MQYPSLPAYAFLPVACWMFGGAYCLLSKRTCRSWSVGHGVYDVDSMEATEIFVRDEQAGDGDGAGGKG